MTKQCKLCGETFETLKYGAKRIYCFNCSPQGTANVITILRHRAKEIGLQKLGGKCNKCGNDKSYLLDFHHRNPLEKEGELSDFSKGYNLDAFLKSFQNVIYYVPIVTENSIIYTVHKICLTKNICSHNSSSILVLSTKILVSGVQVPPAAPFV